MIVPQPRLLFWFALVALPFSALGGVYPEAFYVSVAAIGAFTALVLVDAATATGRLAGLTVELPEILRVSKDRPFVIPVDVVNASRRGMELRLGLPLPPALVAPEEDIRFRLAPDVERSRVNWNCRPVARGSHRLTQACLEGISRLGFWAVRARLAVSCEVRVYPNLLAERKNLAALFLNRGAFGLHAQRQVGKGRDFEKLREYVPGDGFDEIHWKATARRGHPVTKVFQIERTQEVYVVIDASRLSAKPAGPDASEIPASSSGNGPSARPVSQGSRPGTTALERFITAALILGQAAERQGDLFGLITFADQVQTFLRARNGREHYSACRDAIYALEPREVTPDFDEIGAFIRTRLRRRALALFLTSLDDPVLAESFVHNMSLLAGQHLVLVNMLKPPGVQPLFTHTDIAGVDDIYEALGGHLQWHKLRELEKVLQRRGVRFSLVENERLATELVSQYVGVKRRQLL